MAGFFTITGAGAGGRNLTIVVAIGVGLIGLQVYSNAWLEPDLQQSQANVTHTLNVISTARALDNDVRDAESAQRGYLITGDEAYLEPYKAGVAAAPDDLAELERLTADNPEQLSRVAQLQSQINIKFAELQRTVELRRTAGFDAAREVVVSNLGSNAMKTINGAIGEIIAAEKLLLAQRDNAVASTESEHNLINIAIIAVSIVLVIGIAWELSRLLRRR